MTSSSRQGGRQEALPVTEAVVRPDAMPVGFGYMLKSWRVSRRYSQLELALEAEVSQRHLSFLESGRAQPSREMVLRLSEVLGLPLRDRNDLLSASGFAPLYQERALDSTGMVAVKQALEVTLHHHEPYPALAVDRRWNVVLQNAAVDRLLGLAGPPPGVWQRVDPSGRHNLMRLTLHPGGLRPLIRNWQQTATVLLARLQREVDANPTDAKLRALLTDLCSLPDIPSGWRHSTWDAAPPPVLALELGTGRAPSLKLFSMVCSFGTAMDVTADEMRLELFFPSDDFTADFLRGANDGVSGHSRPA